MSKRMRELAEQAGFQYIKDEGIGWAGNYNDSLPKFAELIVKECAQAFEAEVDTWKQMDPYQGSIKRQGAKAIKQHFGVE